MIEGCFMSKEDQLKLSVINDFIYRKITRPEAALQLGTTERTITRSPKRLNTKVSLELSMETLEKFLQIKLHQTFFQKLFWNTKKNTSI